MSDDRRACPCCGADEDRAMDRIVVDRGSSRVRGHRVVCMECGHSTGLYRTGVGALRAWSETETEE